MIQPVTKIGDSAVEMHDGRRDEFGFGLVLCRENRDQHTDRRRRSHDDHVSDIFW